MSRFKVGDQWFNLIDEKLTFAEASAIEDVTDLGFQEILDDPKLRSRVKVMQAFMWVSAKRVIPTLKYSDVGEWDMESTEFEFDDDEPGEVESDPTEG